MFKELILKNQSMIKQMNIISRDYEFYDDLLKLNKIVSFIWPRRVWKTFLMFDFIKRLLKEKKFELEQIVFLDFSLNFWESIDYKILVTEYKELFPTKEPFFIFDEIQDISNFKEFVLALFNWWYKIFISGSNSTLLSSELSTHFRWRVFEYKVLPLTFKEVLRFKNFPEKENYTIDEKWKIRYILNEVLEFWSFPEIVLSENPLFKMDNLKTYFDILFYKDLLERYKIENEVALKYFLKNITRSYTKSLNISKIFNDLQSQQVAIWKNTLYQYWEYIKNIFFAYELENFYNKDSFKKPFLYNIWFNKIISDKENKGQSFENFILLELLKKYDKIYYKKNWWEIDFYVEKGKLNIQVCYKLSTEDVERETKVFKKIEGEKILIYLNKDENLKINEDIKLISFEDFLLIL